jgi:thymidylate synthase
MNSDAPDLIHIHGRNNASTWARLIQLTSQQPERLAGEDYVGNNSLTRHAPIVFELDEEAAEEVIAGKVHEAVELGERSREQYDLEMTYWYFYYQWHAPPTNKFIYNYFDRLVNSPMPNLFLYQGELFTGYESVNYQYQTKIGDLLTCGFDQLKWLHDTIRKDGISRRHLITTWIPAIDCFATSPPCLIKLWVEVLVPKSEWHKYPGCIPVDVHLDYRSWDLAGGLPNNLYALTRMLYRYVFGNLSQSNEFIGGDGEVYSSHEVIRNEITGELTNELGHSVKINEPSKQAEFKIKRLLGFSDNGHVYPDNYDILNRKRSDIQ